LNFLFINIVSSIDNSTPISEKSGHCAIQTRICDLLILLNLYLTDKITKRKKIELIVFCKYKQMLTLMATTHSKKVGTEAQ